MPATLAVIEPGDDVGWLLTELRHRIPIADCRHDDADRWGEGLLVAPFNTDADIAAMLEDIYPEWEHYLALVQPGADRVEKLLAG